MLFKFTNGTERQLDWHEMLAMLRHPCSLALFVLSIVGLNLFPPYEALSNLAGPVNTLFWAHVVGVFLAAYVAQVALLRRLGRRVVNALVLGGCAAALGVSGSLFLAALGVTAPSVVSVIILWLYLWVMLVALELVFVTFLLPHLNLSPRGQPQDVFPGQPPRAGASGIGPHPASIAARMMDRPQLPMRVMFASGQVLELDWHEFLAVFQHRLTVGTILLAIIFVTFAHPLPTLRDLPPYALTLFWSHVVAVYYVLYLGLARLVAGRGWRVSSPLLMVVIGGCLTLTSQLFLSRYGASPASPDKMLLLWVFHATVLLIAEFLHAVFLLPFILGKQAPDPVLARSGAPVSRDATAAGITPGLAALQAPRPLPEAVAEPSSARDLPWLEIADQRIDPAGLRAISSEEHYLRLLGDGRTRFLRGRIADVEAQLPPEIGLRVHRSHWVAAQAVAGVETEAGAQRLVLSCGARIPVARGRRAAVRHWLNDLGIGSASGAETGD